MRGFFNFQPVMIKYYTSEKPYKGFYVITSTGEVKVEFTENSTLRKGEYATDDKEIQEQIEMRPEFSDGGIELRKVEKKDVRTVTIADDETETNEEIPSRNVAFQSVPEVTNINEAKDYLRAQGVHHTKLKTPDKIKAEAQALNIEFPNLVV